MARHFIIGVSLIALGFSSACKTNEPGIDLATVRGVKIKTSEQLLAAEGDWKLVEDEQAPDPLHMHKDARKQVNPNNRAFKQYVPKQKVASASGAKRGADDINYRLIRMQRGLNAEETLVQVAAIDTPHELSALDENESSNVTVEAKYAEVLPARKPYRPVHQTMSNSLPENNSDAVVAVISNLAPAAGLDHVVQIDENILNAVQSSGTVEGIRFGDYPEKTRLVLDLSENAPFKADVQNGQLVLDLPQTGWSADLHKVLNNQLIKSYTASRVKNGGTRLSLELKRPVRVLGSSALPPNSQYGHRIYLDLAAS